MSHSVVKKKTISNNYYLYSLQILASTADSNLGGRDIDEILANHFCKEFQAKYKIDARNNPRAYLRLLAEVEKLKKQMSANSTNLPLNIECFMEEKDVHGDMKRVDMESLCSSIFKRVEHTLKQCLIDSSEFICQQNQDLRVT